MTRRATGEELIGRVNRAFTLTMVGSNAVGAVIVFVFLTVALPVRHPAPLGKVLLINLPPALLYAVAGALLAPRWGRLLARPWLRWLREERPPTTEEQRHVLRNPLVQVKP